MFLSNEDFMILKLYRIFNNFIFMNIKILKKKIIIKLYCVNYLI
jgi:hypothetical protein